MRGLKIFNDFYSKEPHKKLKKKFRFLTENPRNQILPPINYMAVNYFELRFRLLVDIGCVCTVDRSAARKMSKMGTDHFELSDLEYTSCSEHLYLSEHIRTMFLYHVGNGNTQLFALFSSGKMFLYLLAPSRQNLLPNVLKLYKKIYDDNIDHLTTDMPRDLTMDEVRVEVNMKEVQKAFTKTFNQEKKGEFKIACNFCICGLK